MMSKKIIFLFLLFFIGKIVPQGPISIKENEHYTKAKENIVISLGALTLSCGALYYGGVSSCSTIATTLAAMSMRVKRGCAYIAMASALMSPAMPFIAAGFLTKGVVDYIKGPSEEEKDKVDLGLEGNS
jgi:hypothetical protein